ncbi:MAG: DUF3854 domain-containing protein [Cyanobacteria bacterium P01_D01_bin.116]
MMTVPDNDKKNKIYSDSSIQRIKPQNQDNETDVNCDSIKLAPVIREKHKPKIYYLTKQHEKELYEKRKLNPSWCEVNCQSINKRQAKDYLGFGIPYDGIWLEGANCQGQYKPNRIYKKEGEKKGRKYITPLGEEYDIMLPVHPDDLYYWDNLEDVKKDCYIINGHPCIVITEGLFKALAGCSNGIPTVSVLGVEMGLTSKDDDPQGKRYLVPGLERLAKAGIGFIVGFDADSTTNKNVSLAQLKLANQLKKFKVPVYSITGLWSVDESFDNKNKGMDDYIMNHGADKFRDEVLAKAQLIEHWEKQFKDTEEEKKIVSAAGMGKEIAAEYRTKLAWHVNNKAWYWYEAEKKGVWSEVPEEQVQDTISNEIEKRKQHFGWGLVSGTLNFLKGKLRINHWEVRKGFIALEDCVIDANTRKEYPHEPGYRFLSALPYKWSDREKGCELVEQWLLEACEGNEEWVQVIRAAMKASVTERGDLQRFLELIGIGGSGKGTVLRLLTALVGRDNIAITDLKQLEKNRFETASFYGKKLIIITDSEQYAGDVSVLKRITGQDELRYEKKGVQQTGGFRFPGIVVIAANEPMQSKDYTSGLKRRRCSMPFNKVVPPHLRRDLETEFKPYLAGLLAWVLEMPDSEMVDYFRNTDSKVATLASFNAEVLIETNPLAAWADEYLIVDPKAKAYIGNRSSAGEKVLLYTNYCKSVLDAGNNPVSQQRFSRNLLDLLKAQLHLEGISKGRDRNGNYISGIRIRQQEDISTPRLITGEKKNDGFVTDCDGSVTDNVTAESTGSAGCDGYAGCFEKNNVEQKQAATPCENKNLEAKNAKSPSHPSQPALIRDSDIAPPSRVTDLSVTPDRNPSNENSPQIREGSTVFPTAGKYKGKKCKVSAIRGKEYWVYPDNTQRGVGSIVYAKSELSLEAPKVTPVCKEAEYKQATLLSPDADYSHELLEDEYLQAPDDD